MRKSVGLVLAFVLGCAGISVWALLSVGGWLAWASCVFGWSLLALALSDMHSLLLPDVLTLPLVPAGLIIAYANAPDSLSEHLIGSVVGFSVFAAIRAAHRWLRAREGLGFGDVKLMGAIGAWMSWQGLPSVVLIASVGGLATVLLGGLGRSAISWDRRLPFGAYLALGAWLVWLYGPLSLA